MLDVVSLLPTRLMIRSGRGCIQSALAKFANLKLALRIHPAMVVLQGRKEGRVPPHVNKPDGNENAQPLRIHGRHSVTSAALIHRQRARVRYRTIWNRTATDISVCRTFGNPSRHRTRTRSQEHLPV